MEVFLQAPTPFGEGKEDKRSDNWKYRSLEKYENCLITFQTNQKGSRVFKSAHLFMLKLTPQHDATNLIDYTYSSLFSAEMVTAG